MGDVQDAYRRSARSQLAIVGCRPAPGLVSHCRVCTRDLKVMLPDQCAECDDWAWVEGVVGMAATTGATRGELVQFRHDLRHKPPSWGGRPLDQTIGRAFRAWGRNVGPADPADITMAMPRSIKMPVPTNEKRQIIIAEKRQATAPSATRKRAQVGPSWLHRVARGVVACLNSAFNSVLLQTVVLATIFTGIVVVISGCGPGTGHDSQHSEREVVRALREQLAEQLCADHEGLIMIHRHGDDTGRTGPDGYWARCGDWTKVPL